MVDKTYQDCVEIREGVGKDGDWSLDYHTRLDFPDAVRLSTLIEPLAPVLRRGPDTFRKPRRLSRNCAST